MGEAVGSVGMTGQTTLTIPLPISKGRGYSPGLSLVYNNGQGNGCFAIGWAVPGLTIQRRTSKGVPRYLADDEFLAPNGEVMTPELDGSGQVLTTQISEYAEVALGRTYTVTRYFPCVMDGFDRIERWQSTDEDFWLVHTVDGQLHCLGKQALSRIADPNNPMTKIGVWLLEESCSPNGEHICYIYKAEDTTNVDMEGQEVNRTQTANRYLTHVQYGNSRAYTPLYAWGDVPAIDQPQWLFTLVFDYGERTLAPLDKPSWLPIEPWPCRKDSFSDYALGFEVRTHRLCHQVLMFHHFPVELGEPNTLVSRLLLQYEQSPRLSHLLTAQNLAYETNGAVQSIPPLELAYTPFNQDFSSSEYQALPAFAGWNNGVQYQIVDLYGEGVPGILYQVLGDWRYQSPQRGTGSPDAITYSTWQSLPVVPSLTPAYRMLMDFTGNGRLDWIVTQPGLCGYFTLNPDGRWSRFIPFPTFPAEFLQPSAQLADLVGGGLSDLALIGPKSVRLYTNRRSDGFSPPVNVAHMSDNELPVFGHDPAALVAFSDVLGSGQSHLVYIRYNSLECWPNLGRGHFGLPLMLASLNFDQASFDPSRVFLADIDGSGAADLIYAESDRFLIFMNKSGNGFDTTPLVLPMPPGISYDRLDQVSFVDMDGTGTTNLVLSISHMTPSHWCYTFSRTKPYLLERIDNNLGASTTLTYRSSAQEWLDEKQANPGTVCHLPFAMPLLSGVLSLDEISGNTLTQQYLYRNGVYAGVDREFRGFGFVQQLDTSNTAASTAQDIENTAPALTKTWYHTGQENTEFNLVAPPYDDPAIFTLRASRFTVFNPVTGWDDPLGPVDDKTRYQLFRALKGSVLRTEVYGADNSPEDQVPYSVQTNQYQVRLVQPASAAHPYCATITLALEQLTTTYERIEADPQVHQTVLLQTDQYGNPLWNVEIHYARRPRPTSNPYPDTVPDIQWQSSYDPSQQALRLIETRQTIYNLDNPQVWHLAIPYQERQNVITNPGGYTGYPATAQGLDYEELRRPDGVLGISQVRDFAGQNITYYFNSAGTLPLTGGTPPPPLVLVHHIETAELDDEALLAYQGVPTLDLNTTLSNAGYRQQPIVLSEPGTPPATIWVIPHAYTTYVDTAGDWLPFCLPRTQQSTLIVGPQRLTYDAHSCVVTAVTDALDNQTSALYDYRFLTPWQITDPNQNQQQVLFDALGRVVANSFFGTQLASDDITPVNVGFAPVGDFDTQALALMSIDKALTDPAGALQNAASTTLYELYSWMGQVSVEQLSVCVAPSEAIVLWQTLQQLHVITATGHVLQRGHSWAYGPQQLNGIPPSIYELFQSVTRTPVRNAVLVADQYPDSPEQQIQIRLSYSDGFGRELQTKQKTEPGLAYVAGQDGQLVLNSTGQPLVEDTTPAYRWIVSGRVDYSNKGQPVRRYQPYFLDQPQYINDAAMREWSYADTYYYDPLGRECAVVTALGYLRRIRFYPWFTITEDENDTLGEVLTS
ncbi:insecticidal toxin complex [Pseudomonas chlororaphis subsp. aurantiaca]|nr:insecticidal toxin complex [Pseudomonas chlororaphis subsp. aurantiaca]